MGIGAAQEKKIRPNKSSKKHYHQLFFSYLSG